MAESENMRTERLELLGRLAGGIAHDFNNQLLVIAASAEAALASGTAGAHEELDEIRRAADHARDLVRELVAFVRVEAYEPRRLTLNAVVDGARRTLERILDGTVEIHSDLTAADTTVFADLLQLERALLNLALRAQDAMPLGGRLTFSTAAEADAVVLRVSDTGVRRHVRGRGLATVYDIVGRAGGRIAVAADHGQGTTLTIRLPPAGSKPLSRAA